MRLTCSLPAFLRLKMTMMRCATLKCDDRMGFHAEAPSSQIDAKMKVLACVPIWGVMDYHLVEIKLFAPKRHVQTLPALPKPGPIITI